MELQEKYLKDIGFKVGISKKDYFLKFSVFIFLVSCSSVSKKYVSNDISCQYNDPIFKISKEELTLDKEILSQLKKIRKILLQLTISFLKMSIGILKMK